MPLKGLNKLGYMHKDYHQSQFLNIGLELDYLKGF